MSQPGRRRRRLRHLGAAVGSAALLTLPACSGGLRFGPPDSLTGTLTTRPDAASATAPGRSQIVFANLEGTLTTAMSGKCGSGRQPHPNCFAFRDPPSSAHYLKAAGFTVLNDANNHSFDFGAAGQAQTVRSIHAAALAQTGLPVPPP